MADPARSKQLAYEFFRRVWAPPHDLAAIDELMTEDYVITTAGQTISGRDRFKAWVAEMQETVGEATNEHLEVFTNESGDRVVSRWVTRGVNRGLFGLPADGRAFRVHRDRDLACRGRPPCRMLGGAKRLRTLHAPARRLTRGARSALRHHGPT